MKVVLTKIADVKEIRPVRHGDARGFFSEIFREDVLRQHGIDMAFVQENHSLSADRGVVRGLHFQTPPTAQAKLVRVTAGAILDIAVDIRAGSPNYGRHVAVVLSAADGNQLFVPEGFAHGFCTLEPNTQVIYKVNRYYSPEHDRHNMERPVPRHRLAGRRGRGGIVGQGPAAAVAGRTAALLFISGLADEVADHRRRRAGRA